MSFTPISTGQLSESLLGTGASLTALDAARFEDIEAHRPHIEQTRGGGNTLTIIIISALIFITLVALFDVFHGTISNYFARRALFNPNSFNRPHDISRTLVSNREGLKSDIMFAIFCLIIVPILIYLLMAYHPLSKISS